MSATPSPDKEEKDPQNEGTPKPAETDTFAMALAVPSSENDFAALLQKRAKQRKDREDEAVAGLRVQVARLEAALQAETKRRVTLTQQLQDQATAEWERLEQQLTSDYHALATQADHRWLALEDRLTLLEDRWKADVLAAEQATTQTADLLESKLTEFDTQVRQATAQREALHQEMVQKLQQLEIQVKESWDTEVEARQAAVADLQAHWEASQKKDQQDDSNNRDVTARLEADVQALRSALVQERLERQQQDEALVQSLQAYSQHLQESLAGIL
jgi:hypothetical protein